MRNTDDIHVDLFDMTDLKDMSELEQYLPGMGTAYQTPVAGVWNRGQLKQYAEGAAARKLIAEVLQSGKKRS